MTSTSIISIISFLILWFIPLPVGFEKQEIKLGFVVLFNKIDIGCTYNSVCVCVCFLSLMLNVLLLCLLLVCLSCLQLFIWFWVESFAFLPSFFPLTLPPFLPFSLFLSPSFVPSLPFTFLPCSFLYSFSFFHSSFQYISLPLFKICLEYIFNGSSKFWHEMFSICYINTLK